jgi:hypothetical protein
MASEVDLITRATGFGGRLHHEAHWTIGWAVFDELASEDVLVTRLSKDYWLGPCRLG